MKRRCEVDVTSSFRAEILALVLVPSDAQSALSKEDKKFKKFQMRTLMDSDSAGGLTSISQWQSRQLLVPLAAFLGFT
jgi:hypothetical protein